MDKIEIQFKVEVRDGTVVSIGHSMVPHPVVKYSGNGIKWLDESRFLKKGGME